MDSPENGAFGATIALSGTTAVVGRPEHSVFVYTLANGEWREQQELVTNATSPGGGGGQSVAISDDTIAVGVPGNGIGYVIVFTRTGSTWTPTDELRAAEPTSDDYFGVAVAVAGNLMAIGASHQETAYVFARVGNHWIQQKQLFASDNPRPRWPMRFGTSVAISARALVVGAPEIGPFGSAGRAYLYDVPSDLSGTWQETVLVPSPLRNGEHFGASTAVFDRTAVVGAPVYGAASVFMEDGGGWGQQRLRSAETTPVDQFGFSLAVSGNRIVVGAPNVRTLPRVFPGGVFTYVRDPSGGWFLEEEVIAEPPDEAFGSGVALAGDTMIVGSPGRIPAGAAHVYEHMGDAGSACTTNADCGHGYCVAGACCEEACEFSCAECSSGICLPVASGSRRTACDEYVCNGLDRNCPESCVTNGNCIETHFCKEGTCEPKMRAGEACTGPEECLSDNCVRRRCSATTPNGSRCENPSDCIRGFCVDGVCCNDACSGQCEACDVEGYEGKCLPVEGPPHGDRDPCGGVGACEGECTGNVAACTYPTTDTECDSHCENGEETVSTCDGQGNCVSGAALSCGRYVCEGTIECKTSCESDGDCSGDYRCWTNEKTCNRSPRCASDHESESAPGGEVKDCQPYRCDVSTGSCSTSCTSSSDCVEPNVCNPNTQRCVPFPSAASEGCGCRTASRAKRGAWFLELALVMFAAARRRARKRFSTPLGNNASLA